MIVSVPVRLPVAVGVNVTLIVQLAPAANDAPHDVGSAKSPEALTAEMVIELVVPFFSVTVLAALVVESAWFPKGRLAGVTVTL